MRGSDGSKSVSILATYFHSFRATVIVLSIAWFKSNKTISFVPGCENSFIALTRVETRVTPSKVWSIAFGISSSR